MWQVDVHNIFFEGSGTRVKLTRGDILFIKDLAELASDYGAVISCVACVSLLGHCCVWVS